MRHFAGVPLSGRGGGPCGPASVSGERAAGIPGDAGGIPGVCETEDAGGRLEGGYVSGKDVSVDFAQNECGDHGGDIMKKLLAVFHIEALLFLRDFYGFFFTFVFPLLMLYGSIYGNDPSAYFGGRGTMDVSVPAYSAMIIGVTGLMAFPLTLAGYKESRIYKRFDATPAGKGVVIAAQVLVNLLMTLAGFALLFAAGKLVYDIKTEGSFWAILGALLLSIGAVFSLGFFFTAIARDMKISNLLCYVSYFVMIFLSGATMPKEMFPEAVKKFSAWLPLTYVVELLQGVFLGAAFEEYRKSLVVLGTILIVCTASGAALYRRKSWV